MDRRDAAGCTGVQRSSVSVGAGRLMIVAGEGGRERVEGKVWKGGRGKGGLWYGTTDFPHIYHVHSLIGIFAHK